MYKILLLMMLVGTAWGWNVIEPDRSSVLAIVKYYDDYLKERKIDTCGAWSEFNPLFYDSTWRDMGRHLQIYEWVDSTGEAQNCSTDVQNETKFGRRRPDFQQFMEWLKERIK